MRLLGVYNVPGLFSSQYWSGRLTTEGEALKKKRAEVQQRGGE